MVFHENFGMIMWIVLALGAFLFFMGITKKGKTKQSGQLMLWIGLALVVSLFVFPTFFEGIDFGGGTAAVTTATQTAAVAGVLCAVEHTTITLSAIDKFTAVATGGNHRYRVDGNPAQFVADGGTFTASPGNSIAVLWGNESSPDYFSQSDTFTVSCKGTETFSADLLNNGTLTIEVFNEGGDLISDTVNETLGVGDVVTLTAKLKGSFQNGFPYGGVIIAEWNDTEIDDVIIDFGGVETNVPQIYDLILPGSVSTTKAYTVPPIISTDILVGTITIDADDVVNPTSNSDINLQFFASDWYVDEDTGASYAGPAVEDEDDVDVGMHGTAFNLTIG